MQPLTPLDAIGPAFSRARGLLFRDFRLGRFLKVALVAAFTEGLGGLSFNYGNPMSGRHTPGLPTISPEQLHVLFVLGIVAAVVFIPFSLAFLYLSSRFTFVTFDMVLIQRPFVRPGWEAFRRAGNRFFGLRIVLFLFGLCVLVLTLVMLLPGIQAIYHGAGWSRLLSTALVLAPFYLVYLLAMLLFNCFLFTVVVPRMALEDASISESFSDGWNALRPNFGSFLIYFLLRGALSLAIAFIAIIAIVLCVVIVALLIGVVIFGLYHFLWTGGFAGKALVIAIGVLLALALLVIYFAALISVAGFRNCFRQAYAILYYGGHYPALGNLVDPRAAPAPFQPSPPAFDPPPDSPPPHAIW